jgi:hypothetical protein
MPPALSIPIDTSDLYAGLVLDGNKPAGLQIEQRTKFQLVLNLKTAKAPRRRKWRLRCSPAPRKRSK